MPPPGYHKSVTRYKVEQILSPEHLKEYEALMRDPRMTIPKLHRWLLERGYKVGHGAVARHRRRFDKDVQAVRRTAMLAQHFADASRGDTLAVLSDATVARFQQVLLERLMSIDSLERPGGERSRDFSPRDWLELAKTIGEAVDARRAIESLRGEADERARKAVAATGAGRSRSTASPSPTRSAAGSGSRRRPRPRTAPARRRKRAGPIRFPSPARTDQPPGAKQESAHESTRMGTNQKRPRPAVRRGLAPYSCSFVPIRGQSLFPHPRAAPHALRAVVADERAPARSLRSGFR